MKELVNIVLGNDEFGMKEARANKLSEALDDKRDILRWLSRYAKVDPKTQVPLIF